MGNVHKSKAIRLKGDPYIVSYQSSIGNTWVPLHMNRLLYGVGNKALETMHRCLMQEQRNE